MRVNTFLNGVKIFNGGRGEKRHEFKGKSCIESRYIICISLSGDVFFHRFSISCRSFTLGRVHFMFSTIGKRLSDVTMGIQKRRKRIQDIAKHTNGVGLFCVNFVYRLCILHVRRRVLTVDRIDLKRTLGSPFSDGRM